MTTVDRLYKKGLLDRVAEGRAFRYTPRQSPEELQRAARSTAYGNCWDPTTLRRCLSLIWWRRSAAHDAQLLDELQLLVEQKRRELKSKTSNGKEQR